MVIFAAAAAASAGGMFSWNREGFFFEKELQQRRDYQGQEMQIRQFEMYREDIRDLVQLTVRKMDNYLLVNTLQLGFCITLFTDGRPERKNGPAIDPPPWLIGLYAMCNAGAFMYYLLSMWLAMHASIAAHSFGVRILTQCVRLPVPNAAQLDRAAARATDFENMRFQDVLRIPLWRQQLSNLNRAMLEPTNEACDDSSTDAMALEPDEEPANHPVLHLPHVRLFRKLQTNWQAYDAYARVCMAMGTNQILQTLSYEALILLMAGNGASWASLCCVVLFTTSAWVLAKLDLVLSRKILFTSAVLMILPPVLASASLMLMRSCGLPNSFRALQRLLVPMVYMLHVLWIWFTTWVAKSREYDKVKLPTKFRSVLYLDVFNWLDEQPAGPEDYEATSPSRSSGQEVTSNLQNALMPDCQQRKLELQQDLARWESAKVQELLKEDSESLLEIQQLRTDFAAVVRDLDELGGQSSSICQATSSSSESPVWLRMEYNPGELYVYWYCHETDEMKWEEPQGRKCDIATLSHGVAEFRRRVSTLNGRTSVPRVAPGSVGSSIGAVAAGRGNAIVTHGGSSSSDNNTTDSNNNNNNNSSSSNNNNNRELGGGGGPAGRGRVSAKPGMLPWDTVNRGSRALIWAWTVSAIWTIVAVVLERKIPFREEHLSLSCPEASSLGALHLPSPVLLKLGRTEGHSSTGVGGWPALLLQPQGIACDEALGRIALVAGRHAVQVINLNDGPLDDHQHALVSDIQAAVDGCLRSAPRFQGQGFAGISLECFHPAMGMVGGGRQCTAMVLLGGNGRQALRCGLPGKRVAFLSSPTPSSSGGSSSRRGGDGVGGVHSTGRVGSEQGRVLELRGGQWSAIGSSGDGLSSAHSLWVLEQGGRSLVELRPRFNDTGELRPVREIAVCEDDKLGTCPAGPAGADKGVVAGLLHMDVSRARLLLLSPQEGSAKRILKSIPIDGGSAQSWRLPESPTLARTLWRGLCTTSDSIFLAGLTAGSDMEGLGVLRHHSKGLEFGFFGDFGVWRLPSL